MLGYGIFPVSVCASALLLTLLTVLQMLSGR
jgi:hypothetical protein